MYTTYLLIIPVLYTYTHTRLEMKEAAQREAGGRKRNLNYTKIPATRTTNNKQEQQHKATTQQKVAAK